QSLLPNISLNQPNNNSEYLNSRYEKDKQKKCEKHALESNKQREKRKLQNALNMHKKRDLETTDKRLSKCQENLAHKKKEKFPSIELFKEEYEVPQELTALTEIEEMLITQDVREFTTRLSQKVTRALYWLKTNNIFYCDIEIAEDILQSLPDNSLIIDQLLQISDNQSIHEKNNHSNINESNKHLANSNDK
ncbi:27334_t:CDS:2, partial [Gigaspora margarita]